MPCTEDDVMRAYRKKVKRLHPDRGGDQRRFLVLQSDFEQAIAFIRETRNARTSSGTA
jgi:curved DNA-binding protein CbpA